MKIKKIMLVTFVLLAILTIGAVSASDDVASDGNLTVIDEGVSETTIGDAASDVNVLKDDESPYEESGFDPIVPVIMSLEDDEEPAVDINHPDEGTFIISVTPQGEDTYTKEHVINEEDEGCVCWTLAELDITEAGTYFLSAKFIFPNATEESVFENYRLIVTDGEFDITVAEQFNSDDGDETLVTIPCLEGFEGIFVVRCYYEVNEDWELLDQANHTISAIDYNNDINFTVSDFNGKFKYDENYRFCVYLLSNEDEEIDEGRNIADEESYSYNPNDFGFEVSEHVTLFFDDCIVYVRCPEDSEGTICVTIEDENGNVKSFTKNILPKDEVEFQASDLEINSLGDYVINVYVNGELREEECILSVHSPVEFNTPSYLNSDDADRVNIAVIRLPAELDEGNIKIKINGTEHILSFDDFEEADEDDLDLTKLYWMHPHHHGEPIEDTIAYFINNKNLGYLFEKGTYEVSVTLNIEGNSFSNANNVTFLNSNKKTNGGVSIEIFDGEEYWFDDEDITVIKIAANDDVEGYVVITIGDGEILSENLSKMDEDGVLTYNPNSLGLDVGTYEINVTCYDNDDNVIVSNSANITLNYGEDGIMSSDVGDSIDFYDDWGINVWFATNDISGNLVIKLDGVEYYNKHVNSSDFDPEEFDHEGQGHFPFSAYGLKIPVGKYNELTISYFGDDGINDTDVWENVEVTNDPRINLCYSDWDEKTAEFCIWEDNYIHIYPNGDDSDLADIIIIVKIGDEIYVNSTLAELNLDPKYDENGAKFYQFGPTKITDITFGRYDDVVAYYISPKYQKDTTKDEDAPDFIDVVGIVDEVDYADTESTVISVLCNRNEGKIIIRFRNIEKEDIEYDIEEGDKGKFIDFNLTYLNIAEIGDYDIEVGYDDGEYLFDNWLSVTNNTDFRVKSDCEWLNTNEEVFFIFCPQDGQGIIKLSGNNINTIEYTITDKDRGNYIGFTLSQLGITSPDTYDINVEVNGKAVGEGIYELDVPSQVEFNMNSVVVLSDSDENINLMRVASLRLPSDAAGNVTITVDGNLVFNQDVSEFGYLDWDGLFCDIYSSQLSPKVQAGEHKVTVAFGGITTTKTLSFVERNMKSEGDVSIEMFNTTVNIDDHDDYFAIVSVLNDDGSGRISIIIDGTVYPVENIWDDDLRDENDWDNVIGKIYYINLETNNDLRNNAQPGELNVTVVYYDGNGDEVIRNNATITLYRAPGIYICYSNWQPEEAKFYIFGEDEGLSLINVYPNVDNSALSDIIITLKVGNEILFNDSLSKLNYTQEDDNGETVYHVMFSNFNKALDLGRQRVVAYYQSPNYKTDSYRWDGDLHLIDVYLNKESKVDPSFNVESIADAIQGSDVVIVITANEYFTGTVDVKIGNINKTADITKGKGKITVNSDDLAVGSVVVNVTSKEDDNFIAGQKDVKFNVLPKIDPALTIAVANVVEGNPAVVTITTDASFSGNVKVKIGTTEYVVPVSNGKGSLSIPNLAANTYTAVATFDSVGIFAGAEKTTTFTVTKKATAPVKKATKITAKKKTFKAKKKVKKYTITLKSGKKAIKGAKVTLKVGKKTYKAKTNKKGKATFKITKLNKKGKYKAVIKFAGTKLYKASKKTVKITVKK